MVPVSEFSSDRASAQSVESSAARGFAAGWFWFAAAMLISWGYMAAHLTRGWIPVDDGTLAQSALRVFQGQLPHRDFGEMYTGGLAFYHALAFRIFGVKLVALRYAVFAVFVPWVAVIYYLASRFASPRAAAGVALLCATWSLPAYPAAMPSWYNLFLATFGAASMLRYLDNGARRWLFVAGLCGGLTISVKIVGLYYVAGVLLWFVFREQDLTVDRLQTQPRRLSGYSVFVSAGLVCFLVVLSALIRNQPGSAEVFHFFLPGGILSALLLYREWTLTHARDQERFGILFRMAAPFVCGLLVPVVILVWPYWRSGSIPALAGGVFVRGASATVALAAFDPLAIGYSVFAIPIVVAVAVAMFRRQALSWIPYASIAAVMALLLIWVRFSFLVGLGVWLSAATITPLVVAGGVWLLGGRPSWLDDVSELQKERVFLFLCLAGMCSLVQFPFPAPIYFHYSVPLTILAVLAIVSMRRQHCCDLLLAETLAFYVAFAIVFVVPATLYRPIHRDLHDRLRPFSLPVGEGLKVEDPDVYIALARTVNEHAGGRPILAFPECPDVFFLSGRSNATRDDTAPPPAEVRRVIEQDQVSLVVVNLEPYFSGGIPPKELMQEILARFPNSTRIDKYLVRWR